MAEGSGSKVGAAYVEFGGKVNKFQAALGYVKKATIGAGGTLGRAGSEAGTKFARALSAPVLGAARTINSAVGSVGRFALAIGQIYPALSAAGRGVASLVMAGSDLNEVTSAVEQTFGKSAAVIKSAANNAAAKFGTQKTEYLESAVGLGALAQGMGMTDAAAAKFSVTYTNLAADLSSFRNLPFKEALIALRSGLSGEAEPLKRFGVNLKENQVEAMGWAMGLAKVGQELTDEQKSMARAQLIMVSLKKAQGDLGRTQDGVANRVRKATGSIANSWADLGLAVQPAAAAILTAVQDRLGRVAAWAMSHKDDLAKWADAAADGFSRFMSYLESWGPTVQEIVGVVADFTQLFYERASAAWAGVSRWISDNSDVLETWWTLASDAFHSVGEAVGFFDSKTQSSFDAYGGKLKETGDILAVSTRYWDEIWMDTGLRISQWGDDAVAVLDWLAQSFGKFGGWLGANWTDLFRDAFVGAITIAQNFAKNLFALIEEIRSWMASGFKAEFDTSKLNVFSDLGKGFQAKTAAMPEFGGPKFDHSATDKAREELWNGASEKEGARLDQQEYDDSYERFFGSYYRALQDAEEYDKQDFSKKTWHDDTTRGDSGFAGKGPPVDLQLGNTGQKSEVLKISELGKKVQEAAGGGKEAEQKKHTKLFQQLLDAANAQTKLMESPKPYIVK